MELHRDRDSWEFPTHIRIFYGSACAGRPARAYDCILVCTQQIQFWIPATVTFGILYILCTQKGVLRLILGDRLILMYRSWYSSVDLIEFHGQSKSYSSVIFFVFSGIIRPLRAKKKEKNNSFRRRQMRNLIEDSCENGSNVTKRLFQNWKNQK